MEYFQGFITVECPHCGVAAGVSKSAFANKKYNWVCHGCVRPFTLYQLEKGGEILVKKYEKNN